MMSGTGLRHLLTGAGLLFLAACCSENNTVWTQNQLQLNLNLSAASVAEISSETFAIHLINADGERITVDTLSSSNSAQELTIAVPDAFILNPARLSAAEILATLRTNPLPETPPGILGKRPVGLVRIEVAPVDLSPDETNSRLQPYAQIIVPVTRQVLHGVHGASRVGGEVSLVSVGSISVRVIDSTTESPLANAQVLALVGGEGKWQDTSVPAWHTPTYRPVLSRTDSNGRARVSPIGSAASGIPFQLVAAAEGYCLQVTKPTYFQTQLPPVTLKLQPCAAASTNWLAHFGGNEKVSSGAVANSTVEMAYTNIDTVSVQLAAPSHSLSGFAVKVWEGHGADALPLGEPKNYPSFLSELSVAIPTFQAGDGKNGKFTISITPTSSDFSLHLYGKRSVETPSIIFMNSLQVWSSVGSEGIISGLPNTTFRVTSTSCTDGFAIGIKSTETAPVFANCHNGEAEFAASSLALPNNSAAIGGPVSLNFYIKNRYGNNSVDDGSGGNVRTVFVDYGTPDLANHPPLLTVAWGLASATAVAGTTSTPYEFPEGILNAGTTDTIVITPTNIASYVVRFRSPDECSLPGDSTDGFPGTTTGLQLSGFLVGTNAAAANAASDFTPCTASGQAQDRPLTTNDIHFPTDSNDSLVLALRVRDTAGHASTAVEYLIPPCPTNYQSIPGTAICWFPE